MKKILLPLAAVALLFAACDNTPKYTIAGNVEGVQDGTVLLLKYKGRQADTLASSPINGGKFKIEGVIDSISDAYLVIAGDKGRTPMIIENAAFTATLNTTDNGKSKIEGKSPNQSLLNQFIALSQELSDQATELRKDYSDAVQSKDEEKIASIHAQFDSLQKISTSKEDELIKANPDSYVSAYILASRIYELDMDELAAVYNMLSEVGQATTYGKKIETRLNALKTVAIGQQAPNFTLNTPEGTPLSMYDVKGKVKIIDFWASWCGPCRNANPEVVKIYEKYHPQGLEILGVSLDKDKDAWVKAIQDDKLNWNQVSDLQYWNSVAAQLYAVNSIPHILVLDENNIIVARNLHGEELEAKIVELLK